MLKSYAVALVLSTAAPAVLKSEESVKTPSQKKAPVTTTDTTKNGLKTGRNW